MRVLCRARLSLAPIRLVTLNKLHGLLPTAEGRVHAVTSLVCGRDAFYGISAKSIVYNPPLTISRIRENTDFARTIHYLAPSLSRQPQAEPLREGEPCEVSRSKHNFDMGPSLVTLRNYTSPHRDTQHYATGTYDSRNPNPCTPREPGKFLPRVRGRLQSL